MNATLEAFAREEIKRGLARCSLEQRTHFGRLYSPGQALSIKDTVDNLPAEKLDMALTLVERSLKGLKKWKQDRS